jgi:hypothetical protein
MATPPNKPHLRLAYILIILGMGLFALEKFGLGGLSGSEHKALHLDPNLVSILVLAPIVLVAAGCITFVVGSMRRR